MRSHLFVAALVAAWCAGGTAGTARAAITAKTVYSQAAVDFEFGWGDATPDGTGSATDANFSFGLGHGLLTGNGFNGQIFNFPGGYSATINAWSATEVDITGSYAWWNSVQSASGDLVAASFAAHTQLTFTLDAPGLISLSKANTYATQSGTGGMTMTASLIVDGVEHAGAPGADAVTLWLPAGNHTARFGASVAHGFESSDGAGGNTVRLEETYHLNVSIPEPGGAAALACAGAAMLCRRKRADAAARAL